MSKDTAPMIESIAEREAWSDRMLLEILVDYLANQDADDALQDYLEERASDE